MEIFSESSIASISAAGSEMCSPDRIKKSLAGRFVLFSFSIVGINSHAGFGPPDYASFTPQLVQYASPGGLGVPHELQMIVTGVEALPSGKGTVSTG